MGLLLFAMAVHTILRAALTISIFSTVALCESWATTEAMPEPPELTDFGFVDINAGALNGRWAEKRKQKACARDGEILCLDSCIVNKCSYRRGDREHKVIRREKWIPPMEFDEYCYLAQTADSILADQNFGYVDEAHMRRCMGKYRHCSVTCSSDKLGRTTCNKEIEETEWSECTFPSKTFKGDAQEGSDSASVMTGMSSECYFTDSPTSFEGNIEINAELVRTASTNDHFLILKESSSRPSWKWEQTYGEVKIAWNGNTLTLYCPNEKRESTVTDIKTFNQKITMDSSKVRVFLDGSYKMECASLNWSSYYLWVGADEDTTSTGGAKYNSITTRII